MGIVLNGLVSAGLSALDSVLGNSANRMQNEANMNLAQYQFQQNQRAIESQNVYNAPINQMARFKAAGLNPNLIYSQGNPGQQVSVAKYEAPHLENTYTLPKGQEMLSRYMDQEVKRLQVDNLRVQNMINEENYKSMKYDNLVKQKDVFDQTGINFDETSTRKGSTFRKFADIEVNTGDGDTRLTEGQINRQFKKYQSAIAELESRNRDQILRQKVEEQGLNLDLLRQGLNQHDPYVLRIFTKILQKLK